MSGLISLLMRLTGLDAAMARLVGYGALAVAILALVGLHQWRVADLIETSTEAGRVEERGKWQAASAAERLRQADVGARAVAEGAAIAATVARERDDLAAQLEDMTHAADADPDRDALALDAGSVRRLDALGRR